MHAGESVFEHRQLVNVSELLEERLQVLLVKVPRDLTHEQFDGVLVLHGEDGAAGAAGAATGAGAAAAASDGPDGAVQPVHPAAVRGSESILRLHCCAGSNWSHWNQ